MYIVMILHLKEACIFNALNIDEKLVLWNSRQV